MKTLVPLTTAKANKLALGFLVTTRQPLVCLFIKSDVVVCLSKVMWLFVYQK